MKPKHQLWVWTLLISAWAGILITERDMSAYFAAAAIIAALGEE